MIYKNVFFCVVKLETKAKIWKYVNTIKSIIFRKNFYKIIMTSTMILWYWQYFQKIRTALIKRTFFHRFNIGVDAEPWELKNTLMCQLWHVGRLRVNVLQKIQKTKDVCEKCRLNSLTHTFASFVSSAFSLSSRAGAWIGCAGFTILMSFTIHQGIW